MPSPLPGMLFLFPWLTGPAHPSASALLGTVFPHETLAMPLLLVGPSRTADPRKDLKPSLTVSVNQSSPLPPLPPALLSSCPFSSSRTAYGWLRLQLLQPHSSRFLKTQRIPSCAFTGQTIPTAVLSFCTQLEPVQIVGAQWLCTG